MTPTRCVAATTATFLLVFSLTGQTVWSETAVDVPPSTQPAMVFDPARGRVVLFGSEFSGNGQTWEWDGAAWQQLTPAQSPPGMDSPRMVFDSARGRIILVGAPSIGAPVETWEWDGQDWSQLVSPNAPPFRTDHALVYDAGRQRIVLFGGAFNVLVGMDDTWEWDGTDWVQLSPATVPTARMGHAMAYDAVAGRVVMFGGRGPFGTIALGDTWQWDGIDWTPLNPANAPSVRTGHTLIQDGTGRPLMFGGSPDITGSYGWAETWTWDGTDWQLLAAAQPTPRLWHGAAHDPVRDRVVVFGGSPNVASPAVYTDTWEWDGAVWTPVGRSKPVGRWSHAMAFDEDRGRFVLFGGAIPAALIVNRVLIELVIGDTLEFDGTGWIALDPPNRPSPREGHAMVYDAARGHVVLFGGDDNNVRFDDTWVWDGTDWTQLFPQNSPSPRSFHAMSYDSARGVVVLFGGFDTTFSAETWEWDGVDWTQRNPANRPSPRITSMAYDAARGVTVLFGGDNGTFPWMQSTWEWDGTDWTRIFPATTPRFQAGHQMTYDPARRRVVMFAQLNNRSPGETWEWDGVDWTRRGSQGNPIWRSYSSIGYDPESERVWLVGGAEFQFDSFLSVFDDTNEYFTTAPAGYTTFGVGCAGSDGAPALTAAPFHRPWIGDRFRLVVDGLPATGAAGLVFGLSGTQWLGLQLPFSLAGLGMPGCTLFASGELFLPVVNTGGRATVDLSIPNDPTLVGQPFYNQVFAADPGANPRGWIVSNAGEAVMGER